MLQKSDINIFYSWLDQFDYSCSGTTFLNVLQILTVFIHSYIDFSNSNRNHNNDNIVNFFLEEIELIRHDNSTSNNIINNINDCISSDNLNDMSDTSSNNIKLKVPSLLCTLLDLADCLNQSNQNLTTSSQRNYHHLLWILDACKGIDERMKNYINQRINIKNNNDKLKQLEKKKLKAKEKILNKIKLNADSFSKLMDNIDSNEDMETDNKIDIKTNDKVDDTDLDSKADNSADNICIICHSNNSDNIGYLALTQVSTILSKKLKQLHIKNDDTFDHPLKCYSHISFCGHSMHYSCYDDFYATVISRSDIQNNLIIDTNKGQFQCPLCKKLNNMIIPHSNIIPSNNRKRLRDSNDHSNDQIINNTTNTLSNQYSWINWYLSFSSLSNNDVDVSVNNRINLDDLNVPHDLINFNLFPVISQRIEELFTTKKSNEIKLNSFNTDTDIHVNTSETSQINISVVNEENRNRSNQPVSRLRNMFQGLIQRIYPSLHHEEIHRDIHQLMDLDDEDDDLISNAIINEDELELSNNTIMNATMTSNTKFLDKIWYRFVTDICAPIDSYMSTPVPYSIPLYVNNNPYEINPILIYYLNSVIKSVAFTISLDESESSIPGYFLISNSNNINDIKLIDKVVHGLVGLINSCNIRSVIEESIQQSLFGINTNYNVNPFENDLISGPILLKNLANVTIIVILLHLSNQSNKSTTESANNLNSDTPTSDHVRCSNIKSSIQNIIIIHLIQTILDFHVQSIDETYYSNISVNDDFKGIYFTINVIESLLSKYFPNSYLSNVHINYIIHKWLSFVKCVSHIVYRLLPDLLVHPSNNINKEYKTNNQDITTNQLINILELFDLTILLDTTLTVEIYLQYSIINIWITDLFNYVSKSKLPINELMKLTNLFDNTITNTLSLIPLSNSYTSLHGQVTSLCNYEFPAICLICGEILDGNGKGHCTKHVQYCNGETGMYFLVQDCTILITHGPRACYLPAPYVDEFGERHRHHRGKPLHLDQRMYDMLRKIWISHNIPREVVQKRSNSTRVIIFGHY